MNGKDTYELFFGARLELNLKASFFVMKQVFF